MIYDYDNSEGVRMNDTKTSRKGAAALLSPLTPVKSGKVDMKGAVQKAIDFAREFFPEAKGIRLEEVEPGSNGWSVVISFTTGEPGALATALGQGGTRVYKTITVSSEGGHVQSLKVWKQ
jgi:hypothetical protein